jgi:hypothetical protein
MHGNRGKPLLLRRRGGRQLVLGEGLGLFTLAIVKWCTHTVGLLINFIYDNRNRIDVSTSWPSHTTAPAPTGIGLLQHNLFQLVYDVER